MHWILVAFICFTPANVGEGNHDCDARVLNTYNTFKDCEKYGYNLNNLPHPARVLEAACVLVKGETLA